MTHIFIWLIAVLSVAGVIIRPFNLPETIWAIGGAVILVLFGLISPADGFAGVLKGLDVYLFLTGMMLLAESAREEKLFDWMAAHATKLSNGSAGRLFLLIYFVGTIVTIFLSNDATAVVLTPAVVASAKAAKVKNPLPYLLVCAFIANAASFVLPISNPANLIIYAENMPPLLQWLQQYIVPSVVAIIITFIILRFTQRKQLSQKIETNIPLPNLSAGGKTALYGIGITVFILLIASAKNMQLGLPTAIASVVTTSVILIKTRKKPVIILKQVSWSVLSLVAGLFVIVEALNNTGLIQHLVQLLNNNAAHSVSNTVWESGFITAFSCNLMNNLPAGLIMGNVIQLAHVPEIVKSAVLIGIDLGPNLSVTGSLATILWLIALRREGITVSAWKFLKLGVIIMTTTLGFAIASLWI